MFNYEFFKKLLFLLPPETAHHFTLKMLFLLYQIKMTAIFPKLVVAPREVMGLHFPNRVGLAAGFDKNGDYIDALAALGFGFIEVGTVTPHAQKGNPLPRLFRLAKDEAIINRMGFNNKGVDYLVERLKKKSFQGILGINIGKGKETPIEKALDDYLYSLKRVLPFASYVTINISSPNTENLRQLQHADFLQTLLRGLKHAQTLFSQTHKKYVPLVVKVAPDLSHEDINNMAAIFLAEKIDGIIATNTTIEREGLIDVSQAKETGGLSGKPLFARSTNVLTQFFSLVKNDIPIIASGGIVGKTEASDKLKAGASLLQLYSGLIYRGPRLINQLVNEI